MNHQVAAAIANHLPEGVLVLVRGTASLGRHRLFRARSQRSVGSSVQLALHFGSTLLTLNGMAQVNNLLFHALVGGRILSRHQAGFVLVLVQELLSAIPDFTALHAHIVDLTHGRYPPLSLFGHK